MRILLLLQPRVRYRAPESPHSRCCQAHMIVGSQMLIAVSRRLTVTGFPRAQPATPRYKGCKEQCASPSRPHSSPAAPSYTSQLSPISHIALASHTTTWSINRSIVQVKHNKNEHARHGLDATPAGALFLPDSIWPAPRPSRPTQHVPTHSSASGVNPHP